MSSFPPDPKKLQATIRRYARALEKEQSQYGAIRAGRGQRYRLGPRYLLTGDLAGALRSFTWFEQTFPEDIGEPGHCLCWTLARYQHGEPRATATKLRQTMLMNLYIIPHLLEIAQPRLEIWHSSNQTESEYIPFIPPGFFQLWDEKAVAWASAMYHSTAFVAVRTRYIEIFTQLQHEPTGPKRAQLVKAAFALR